MPVATRDAHGNVRYPWQPAMPMETLDEKGNVADRRGPGTGKAPPVGWSTCTI